ncbi:MAG TPA: alpha/beta fold hydrolase [Polyangiaceae bacterium]|nr:alpha/beta fold hydrolase [Polyangiaceae bacterium]
MTTPDWLDRTAWPFEPHAAPVTDGRLHFVDEGKGPAVVLVHGTPTWSFEWRHVIAQLRSTHRVIAPDHLGFGLSERPATANYSPEAHAARFREFMQQVLPSGSVSLVVHDFGGPIALDWALECALENPQRLRHLIVVNTWMWPFDDPKMQHAAKLASGALGRFLYRHLNASQKLLMPSVYGDRKKLTPAIHAQYLSVFPDADSREQVLFALAKALLGSRPFYESLWQRRAALCDVPMTVMWGLKDSAFPPTMLQRWKGAFPQSKVVEFAGAGHWPHEEEVEAFNAALHTALNP